jgi:hypothetical protein
MEFLDYELFSLSVIALENTLNLGLKVDSYYFHWASADSVMIYEYSLKKLAAGVQTISGAYLASQPMFTYLGLFLHEGKAAEA